MTRYAGPVVVKTIVSSDGSRKLDILRRPDGSFSYQEWKWLTGEQSWSVPAQHPISVIDNLDHAIEEIKGRISWVTDDLLKASS